MAEGQGNPPEPRVLETLAEACGRVLCRLLGWHNRTCRGRLDHDPSSAAEGHR